MATLNWPPEEVFSYTLKDERDLTLSIQLLKNNNRGKTEKNIEPEEYTKE